VFWVAQLDQIKYSLVISPLRVLFFHLHFFSLFLFVPMENISDTVSRIARNNNFSLKQQPEQDPNICLLSCLFY